MIGLGRVKEKIAELQSYIAMELRCKEMGLPVQPLTLHLAFTGNPGTGKSSVARLVGEIYHEMGILSKGHTVEVGRSDLVGKFVGTTAPQTMELLESAKGGVFFLDEAYTLVNDSPEDYGQEAIDTILTFMENNRHDFVLIVAGYESPMLQFLQSNEGLLSRFGKDQIIHFDDYNPDELFEIFQCFCRETRHRITKEAAHEVQAYLTHLYNHRDVHFGNAREVRSYFENLQKKQAVRLSARGIDSATADDLRTFELADVRWRETTDEDALPKAMEKLNSLIGLSRVKKEVADLVTLAKANKLRTQMGQPVRNFSLHLVFTGSPGTGKSTVAALMGDIYHALGLLPEGQMIRTSRNGLVAGFVGQTAKQTRRVIDTARGGVLFIDEAYTLTPDVMNDFGPEAVETIMDEMEVHRDDLVVIVAGYADRMEHFLDTNPGLRSRFNTYIHFDDYTPDELLQIFEAICQEDKMELSDLARQKLKEYFSKVDIATFGNARGVRNLYEKVLLKTYARGINDLSQGLSLIQAEDIPQT
jgi:SpoVK/Ycf46/Vps4 family AAA+-type ATPase